jgi:lipopolysaccharide export system permease protein
MLTAVTSIFLVPHSKFETKKLLFSVAKKKASIGIKEKVFNDDFKGILLYAENIPVHGNFMEGVIISDSRMTKEPSTIVAKKAYLVSDPNMMTVTLRLENGSTHSVDTKLKNYRKMDFSTYDINLDIESSLAEEKKIVTKKSSEMTLWEIAATLKKAGLEERFLRELSIEFNKTIATPFACIVFGIIGIPLGIRSHRTVKSRGFTVGIFIVFIYYIIRLGGEALAEMGRFSPFMGTWAPNIIFCMAGIYLLIMAAKDRPFTIHTMWEYLKKLVGKEKGH